jgi:dihydroorotate dehydrogenase (NAD+) catalytic subunit
MAKPDLKVSICGVEFANPVIAASGCFGFGRDFAGYYDLSRLGGISVKGLTPEKREGNAPSRIAETASGMLNSVGLQNPGIEGFLIDEMPYLKTLGTRIIANIAGKTIDEYMLMARKLRHSGVDMIELNISCPNVKEGGVAFGAKPESIYKVVNAVKPHCAQPLIVKLTPNTLDITENAQAAEAGGADAISLINTLTGMAIDIEHRRPVLANVTGGLSGPAIKPIALRMVWQAAHAVSIPVIGMGGIMTGSDAVEFLMVGASAVQVGTANLIDPMACVNIIEGLEQYMGYHDIATVQELVGSLKLACD